MYFSLTTTAARVIEPADYDRQFLISAGIFDAANTVLLRYLESGSPDMMIWRDGNNSLRAIIPAGRSVYAYTDAGTAKLSVLKEAMM